MAYNIPLSQLMRDVGILDAPRVADEVLVVNEPEPEQLNTMRTALRYERFADFSKPGAGKTYPMHFNMLVRCVYGNKCVAIMPPNLIPQFCEEFTNFFEGVGKFVKIHPFNQTAAKREKLISEWDRVGEWPDILVMSYQIFKKYADVRKHWFVKRKVEHRPRPVKVKVVNEYAGFLQKRGYNCFYPDEADALKNPRSENHKVFWRTLGETQGQYSLYMATGTPSGKGPEDTYGLIRLKTPEAYRSWGHFERTHLVIDDSGPGEIIIGYEDLDLLNHWLYKNSVRVIPKYEHEVNLVEETIRLSPEHMRLYNQVVKDRMLEVEGKEKLMTSDSMVRATAKQLISSPEFFTDEPVKNLHTEKVCEFIDRINPKNNKIIIFTYFKASVATLVETCQRLGLNPSSMNSESDTEKARLKFLHDPTCRVIVINWISGGAGLNFQSVCNNIIFADTPTTPKDYEQAIARVRRKNQKYRVNVFFVRVLGTIAGRQIKTLLKRDGINSTLLKDNTPLLKDLFFDSV